MTDDAKGFLDQQVPSFPFEGDFDVQGEEMDFFTACSIGAEEIVSSFLKSGVSPSLRNNAGWTGAHYAASAGRANVLKQLVSTGPGLSSLLLTDGTTPLMLACEAGHLAALRALDPKEDEIDSKNESGKTALFLAVEYANLDVINYLLGRGASPNVIAEGMTPLAVAARSGHSTVVAMLLANGANPSDNIALKVSMQANHEHVVTLITKAIADQEDLQVFLIQLNLEKYWVNFKKSKIGMRDLMAMGDPDLKAIGISLLGPRKKILNAIKTLVKQKIS